MTLLTAKTIQNATGYTIKDFFSLTVHHHLLHTDILMKVTSGTVNTGDIPWTYRYLQNNLPSILASTCFNEEKLPFSREVKKTEIGHLFEHILLEYLCQEKLLLGHDEAVYSGRTNWNWVKEPFGLFHISIDMPSTERNIFPEALRKSTSLLIGMIRHDISHQASLNNYPSSLFSWSEMTYNVE